MSREVERSGSQTSRSTLRMAVNRTAFEVRLVNGSTGDPVLYIDYPGRDNALLFDAGETGRARARTAD